MYIFKNVYIYMYIFMCVCVCARQRERGTVSLSFFKKTATNSVSKLGAEK